MKLQVLHKGLIFLVVAFALIGVFFFQLFQLVSKAERLAASDVKLSHLVNILDAATIEYADGLSDLGVSVFSRRHSDVDPAVHEAKIRKLLDEVRSVAGDDPSTNELLSEADKLAREEAAVLSASAAKTEAGGTDSPSIQTFLQYLPVVKSFGKRVMSLRNHLIEKRAELEAARLQERQTNDQIKKQVVAGLVASVFFLLLVTVVFLKDITYRLSVLVRNAQAIPSGQKLIAEVAGSDELAYLDGVLHSVTDQLIAAGDYRKTMMGMIAHDLRAPITSAQLSLNLLLESHKDQTVAAESKRISRVRDNLGRLLALIEDLLTIDKLQQGKLELNCDWVDVRTIVEESFGILRPVASAKDISMINEAGESLIDADKKRLLQVFQNLLSNAIKYSSPGGLITVRTQLEPKHIKMMVVDQGTGIPEDKQAMLFEKYYQVDKSDASLGFGLGLAISKLIVTAHGGSIGVESVAGQGSTFWFTLPLDEDAET